MISNRIVHQINQVRSKTLMQSDADQDNSLRISGREHLTPAWLMSFFLLFLIYLN